MRLTKKTVANRRGVATVEFALTAPVLFLLVLAGVEFSRANVLINTAKVAASEGARRGIVVGTTNADIEAVVRKELSVVGVRQAEVLVDPIVISDSTKVITVGVSVPLDQRNGYIVPRFFVGDFVWKITSIPRETQSGPEIQAAIVAASNDMKNALQASAKSDKQAQKALAKSEKAKTKSGK